MPCGGSTWPKKFVLQATAAARGLRSQAPCGRPRACARALGVRVAFAGPRGSTLAARSRSHAKVVSRIFRKNRFGHRSQVGLNFVFWFV